MSVATNPPFRYRFVPGTNPVAPPLLLLHGTGGDENDLLPLGRLVSPGSALLSPRGMVLEDGMPRFFHRLSEVVFDEDDLRRRTADLAFFVAEARAEHRLAAPIAVGFSNGANIAASLLMLHPGVLGGAALLRAMAPFANAPDAAIPGTPVLLVSGMADPIVPAGNAARLASQLTQAGASVNHRTFPAGHRLSDTDVQAITAWLVRGLS